MADILFIHNNFPAQFGFLARALVAAGHRCAAIASGTGTAVEGVHLVRWGSKRSNTPDLLPAATRIEADLIRGAAAARAAEHLRAEGFSPALIIGHPGWGETIYMREIFPAARQIAYAEYYYRGVGGDVGFDPEFSPARTTDGHELYAKNAGMALAFAEAQAIVAPTAFQQSLLPETFRLRSEVIHEGVDTATVKRHPAPRLTLASGKTITPGTPVVTFINRRFEPLRGFHIFARALPALLEAVPDAEVVVIGADEPGGYGTPAGKGETWGRKLFAEVESRLDRSRVHFVGRVSHATMLATLSLSNAHVYFTYPFVMSWSLLDAMAAECLVVGSDTAPVRDAITHGENGLLVDFFDVEGLSRHLIAACREPEKYLPLRGAARTTVVQRFDRASVCLPAWLKLIDGVLGGAA